MDGDEMTRIMWKMIKEKLLYPFLDMEVEYYDLHIKNRDVTNDAVTVDAARAVMKYGIGVKCATITANQDRVASTGSKRCGKVRTGRSVQCSMELYSESLSWQGISNRSFRPGKNRLRSEGTHTETSTIISKCKSGGGKSGARFYSGRRESAKPDVYQGVQRSGDYPGNP